jgi:WD40 repeat protein/predicted Ser/Thr protein kinase
MTADDPDTPDDALLDHLAACAEAIASGVVPPSPLTKKSADALAPGDWQQLVGCLLVLETLRPVEPMSTLEDVPPKVPGFAVGRELGRGGMGVVYLATDLTLCRPVAMKVLRAGRFGDREEASRLRTEAEASARLRHPNIIPVFAAGEADGRTFLIMEYVEGESLGQRLSGKPLPPAEAARLVAVLAGAVHHAHAQGVVHRDLKPANVLLDAAETPRIADFGLAKLLDRTGGQTTAGQILGTAEYMAPEQTTAVPDGVGPAADVYALGAILYECLTGRPPFRAATPFDTLQQVREADPVPPRRLHTQVPADLDTVCLKCLEKNPACRYSSADELAADLRRFVSGEPVRARPVGWAGRTTKWVRRRPAVAGLLTAVAAAVAVGFAVSLSLWRQAEIARAAEADERLRAERLHYASDMSRASAAGRNRDFDSLRPILDAHRLAPGRPDRRGFEWHYWDGLCRALPLRLDHPGEVLGLGFAPDGSWIASVGSKTVCVWNSDGSQRYRLTGGHADKILSLAVAPDGRWIASGSSDGRIVLWDPQTGTRLGELPHSGTIVSLTTLADGRLIAANHAGDARLWDAAGGPERRSWSFEAGIRVMIASPDGRRAVVQHDGGAAKLWDLEGDRLILQLPDAEETAPAFTFSPDGRRLAVGERSGRFVILDASTGRLGLSARAHEGTVTCMGFSADGRWLATAGTDLAVRIWDAANGSELAFLPGYAAGVLRLAFAPDGRRLLTAGDDSTVRLWRQDQWADRLYDRPTGTRPARMVGVAWHPEGRLLAGGCGDGTVRVWDAVTGRQRMALPGVIGWLSAVAYSPDGRLLAAGRGGAIRIWNAETGAPLRDLDGHGACAVDLAFSPDSRRLVSGGFDDPGGSARVWDVASGQRLLTLAGHTKRVAAIAYSPDGTRIVSAGSDGIANLWDARTGERLHPLHGPRDEDRAFDFAATAVAWHPDGRQFAVAGLDAVVRVWNAATGDLVSDHCRATKEVWGLAYSPDGARLAVASWDGTIRLYDSNTFDELLTVSADPRHRRWCRIAFSPCGGRLAVTSEAGFVQVFDGRPRTPELETEKAAGGLVRFWRDRGCDWPDVGRRIRADLTLSNEVRRAASTLADAAAVPP